MWDKRKLLEQMKFLGPGTAEFDAREPKGFLRNFLVIGDYRYALDPDTLLILGGRGVGKSALFQVLNLPEGAGALVDATNSLVSLNWQHTYWIRGFGKVQQDSSFPTPETVSDYMTSQDAIAWRAFWIGLVLGRILQDCPPEVQRFVRERLPNECIALMEHGLSKLSRWFPLIRQNLETTNDVLDQLDKALLTTDSWLFVTYDELDRLVPSYRELSIPIRELLALWLDRWRRWHRIRPKIFLRSDLFGVDRLQFPDASKFSGHQVRLDWSPNWLYRLLVKRLANSGTPMTDYVQRVEGLIEEEDPTFGYVPTADESRHKRFIDRMIGEFMGANARKGITFRWIPNHLMDAGGKITPRSFIKLFAFAADLELERFDPTTLPDERLLRPTNIQGALMQTSLERINELVEEYPWISELKPAFQGIEVPVAEERFITALESVKWKGDSPPPSTVPGEVMETLIQLGILERRFDGRINAPEIYMHGFGMKRRGGVKRPR
ncbi:P-loop ATPase, Sll1717 family [Alicyclobacillus macrosporangiidus]|uniref:Uncharacterized protein n=1 Tax=Alicyclobacillus macrosporangiidus TaxID=392015 RepID=A0A1I7JIG6_9BACL|nr:hypothetical protein [Alicyclobacillus macrosporangiidus]SFU84948.1 hypothetical protein SAMN05421543_11052 [Alicyclobacillus macrosporangiidus]